jgi:hypothetical protein
MEKNRYNLPIFDMMLDENTAGLYTVSLVDDPAMEVNWFAFEKEDNKPLEVKMADIMDEMEHKVMTVICRADFPILRRDDEGQYFYVQFPKETIKMMAQRFLKNGFQELINIQHEADSYVQGVEMEQLFIKDTKSGINPVQFQDIEEGSLFGIYKIENEEIWNDIMNGKYTSVSLEGLFKPVLHVEDKDKEIETIEELIDYLR